MSDGLDARRLATHAFDRAFRGKGAIDETLNNDPAYRAMETRDRAFARLLAATTLRRIGQTQAALDSFIATPLSDDAHGARALLQTGAAQMIWLGTAPHAAVSGTVGLAKESPGTARYAGLINAVLRKIANEGTSLAKQTPEVSNLPTWLQNSWRSAYGQTRLTRMAASAMIEPTLDLSLRDESEASHWADMLGMDVLPTGSLRKSGIGDLTALPGFEDGAWWAQDAGAALPAKLLSAQTGEAVLDLCAAPGGKTLQLATTGAAITALDASAKRLKRLSENLARTGLEADIIVANGRKWESDARFDAILLDAPCTATGTLRRRPDAAWLKQASDAKSLAPIQDDLAKTAINHLNPGGRLVICTCSLQPEEGEHWLARILAKHSEMTLDPVRPEEMPELETAILENGSVRLTPDLWFERGGIDGFFIARLVKAGH